MDMNVVGLNTSACDQIQKRRIENQIKTDSKKEELGKGLDRLKSEYEIELMENNITPKEFFQNRISFDKVARFAMMHHLDSFEKMYANTVKVLGHRL